MNYPQEQVLTVAGVNYRLSTLSLNVLGEFLAYAKTVLPDPFDKFQERFGACPEAIQKMAFERAASIAEKRGTVDDPESMALIHTVHGLKKLVTLMFRKHQPHLTDDQVGDIIDAGIQEKGDAFLAGLFPAGEQGERKHPRKSR